MSNRKLKPDGWDEWSSERQDNYRKRIKSPEKLPDGHVCKGVINNSPIFLEKISIGKDRSLQSKKHLRMTDSIRASLQNGKTANSFYASSVAFSEESTAADLVLVARLGDHSANIGLLHREKLTQDVLIAFAKANRGSIIEIACRKEATDETLNACVTESQKLVTFPPRDGEICKKQVLNRCLNHKNAGAKLQERILGLFSEFDTSFIEVTKSSAACLYRWSNQAKIKVESLIDSQAKESSTGLTNLREGEKLKGSLARINAICKSSESFLENSERNLDQLTLLLK